MKSILKINGLLIELNMKISSSEMTDILRLAASASGNDKIRELNQADRKMLSLVLNALNKNKGEVDIKDIADNDAFVEFKKRLAPTEKREQSGAIKRFGKGLGNVLGLRLGSAHLQKEIQKTESIINDRETHHEALDNIYGHVAEFYREQIRNPPKDAAQALADLEGTLNKITGEIEARTENGVDVAPSYFSYQNKELKISKNLKKSLMKEQEIITKKKEEMDTDKSKISEGLYQQRWDSFKNSLVVRFQDELALLEIEYDKAVATESQLDEFKKLVRA